MGPCGSFSFPSLPRRVCPGLLRWKPGRVRSRWGRGLTARERGMRQRGGMLHDMGKIGIPGSILDKPEKLTAKEFAMIQEHPEKGARILEPIPAFQNIIPIVTQHHERFDGKGYPRGPPGRGISLGARILAGADVYDDLTSARASRGAFRPVEAVFS